MLNLLYFFLSLGHLGEEGKLGMHVREAMRHGPYLADTKVFLLLENELVLKGIIF